MLSATHRMRVSSDFDVTVRRGARFSQKTVVAHFVIPDETDETTASEESEKVLVGFVVSKAVGNSVVRNLVKRRMRAIVREQLDALPVRSRLVLRALPAAATADFATLKDQLEQAIDGVTKKYWSRHGIPVVRERVLASQVTPEEMV